MFKLEIIYILKWNILQNAELTFQILISEVK